MPHARRHALLRVGSEVRSLSSSPLEQDLDLDDLLDEKLEQCLEPLRGLLDEEELAFLRTWGSECLREDPVLQALVERLARAHGESQPR